MAKATTNVKAAQTERLFYAPNDLEHFPGLDRGWHLVPSELVEQYLESSCWSRSESAQEQVKEETPPEAKEPELAVEPVAAPATPEIKQEVSHVNRPKS